MMVVVRGAQIFDLHVLSESVTGLRFAQSEKGSGLRGFLDNAYDSIRHDRLNSHGQPIRCGHCRRKFQSAVSAGHSIAIWFSPAGRTVSVGLNSVMVKHRENSEVLLSSVAVAVTKYPVGTVAGSVTLNEALPLASVDTILRVRKIFPSP